MAIGGIALLVIAGLLFFFGRRSHERAGAILSTQTSCCRDVADLFAGVASELGGGALRHAVELDGRAGPGTGGPVTAPHSGEPSVWYRSEIVHHYWGERWRSDPQGGRRRERHRTQRTVSQRESDQPFAIVDDTGSVAVDPRGAKIDQARVVHDEMRMPDAPEGFGGAMLKLLGGNRDIGFQHREWAIVPDERLYVLGEATEQRGTVIVGAPSTKGGHYLISTRSESELLASAHSSARWFTIGAIACAVVGLGLLVASFFV